MANSIARRFVRGVLLALCAVVLVGLAAPLINAARFGGVIQTALETSLGRKVTFEKAYFTVFSGPGFSLQNVTIAEDPGYGIEPFAYVPTLQARLRLDKLLTGKVRFASLRLVDPSLNLVKRPDGGWNVVQLVQRLTTPRAAPLNLFPAFEVADGRVDFKLGTRKTTLYISSSDLSIYPERSGKLYIRFSGAPSRTDRAGMGFGHFRGSVNWFLPSSPTPNQLEAELDLDPSNLSELTTLLEGQDLGVHGTVSSKLHVKGPLRELKAAGELRLNDVHRWDLLPSSGEAWTVRYGGDIDLLTHRLDLRTSPSQTTQAAPVTMHVRVNDFWARAGSSVVAELHDAPLPDLLPLATRLGVVLPNHAALQGVLNGAIGYASEGGLSGGLVLNKAEASLPGAPTLSASAVNVTVSGDHVHFQPAQVEAGSAGELTMGGNYFLSDGHADASLSAVNMPLRELKPLANSWFGGLSSFSAMSDGQMTGQLSYRQSPRDTPSPARIADASWSGQFDLRGVSIKLPGLALPLRNSQAHVTFNQSNLQVDHLSGILGDRTVRATYRYNSLAKHTERVRLEFPVADLVELEGVLTSANHAESLWDRLRFLRRSQPAWLKARNLEGDLLVTRLLADGQPLGALATHFIWQGASLAFTDTALHLPQGKVSGTGVVDLASFTPHWRFTADVADYPWSGGLLQASGRFASTGAGKDLLRNLDADGSFEGADLALSATDTFENISGLFRFTFSDGWPDLKLTSLRALQDGDEWNGEGATESDGKLLIDLARAGKQVHFVSSLSGEKSFGSLAPEPKHPAEPRSPMSGLK